MRSRKALKFQHFTPPSISPAFQSRGAQAVQLVPQSTLFAPANAHFCINPSFSSPLPAAAGLARFLHWSVAGYCMVARSVPGISIGRALKFTQLTLHSSAHRFSHIIRSGPQIRKFKSQCPSVPLPHTIGRALELTQLTLHCSAYR